MMQERQGRKEGRKGGGRLCVFLCHMPHSRGTAIGSPWEPARDSPARPPPEISTKSCYSSNSSSERHRDPKPGDQSRCWLKCQRAKMKGKERGYCKIDLKTSGVPGE